MLLACLKLETTGSVQVLLAFYPMPSTGNSIRVSTAVSCSNLTNSQLICDSTFVLVQLSLDFTRSTCKMYPPVVKSMIQDVIALKVHFCPILRATYYTSYEPTNTKPGTSTCSGMCTRCTATWVGLLSIPRGAG